MVGPTFMPTGKESYPDRYARTHFGFGAVRDYRGRTLEVFLKWASHCGKTSYASPDEALETYGDFMHQEGLNVYPCSYCPAWHVGHTTIPYAEWEDDCVS